MEIIKLIFQTGLSEKNNKQKQTTNHFLICSICCIVKLGKMNCLIMVIYRLPCKIKLHEHKVRYSAICKITFFLEGGGNILAVW